jgi:hypothetical protein
VSLTKGRAADEPTEFSQAADFEFYNNGVIVRPTRAISVPGRFRMFEYLPDYRVSA